MKIFVESLFPVGIMVVDQFVSDDERIDIIDFINNQQMHQNDETVPKNAYSTFDGNSDFVKLITDNIPSCRDFYDRVTFALNEHAQVLGLGKLKLTNSWSHIQTKGSYIVEHTHPNSRISGVLYLNTDKDSNNLTFKNPNPYSTIENPVKQTDFNYGTATYPAENGRLILFPSWLVHGSNYQENKTNKRIVISFNSDYS